MYLMLPGKPRHMLQSRRKGLKAMEGFLMIKGTDLVESK